MEDERISRIVENAVPDQGESLAGRTSDNHVDTALPCPGCQTDLFARNSPDVTTDDARVREIELVGRCVNRIVLDRNSDIESSLLESKRQSTGPGEQVDAD